MGARARNRAMRVRLFVCRPVAPYTARADDEGGACAAAAPLPALPVLDALAMNLTPFKTIVLGPRWGAQQGATETRFAVKRASPKGFFEAFAQPALELIFDAPSDVEAIAWTHAIERTSRSIAV